MNLPHNKQSYANCDYFSNTYAMRCHFLEFCSLDALKHEFYIFRRIPKFLKMKEDTAEEDEEEFQYDDVPDVSSLTMHGKTFANVQASKYDPGKENIWQNRLRTG